MKIEIDDLSRPQINALLNEHLQSMYALTPPESVHALNLEKLSKPEITFWSAWEGSLLLGCGALKELDRQHGEVKSMRTPNALRRRGAGRAILAHIIKVAIDFKIILLDCVIGRRRIAIQPPPSSLAKRLILKSIDPAAISA